MAGNVTADGVGVDLDWWDDLLACLLPISPCAGWIAGLSDAG